MTQNSQTSDASMGVHRDGAPALSHGMVTGRRLVSRILPGSVVMVAALTLPEFSLGAGDLAGSTQRTDPPSPIPARDLASRRAIIATAAAGPDGGLAGVRYAALLSIKPAPSAKDRPVMALSPSRPDDPVVPVSRVVIGSLPRVPATRNSAAGIAASSDVPRPDAAPSGRKLPPPQLQPTPQPNPPQLLAKLAAPIPAVSAPGSRSSAAADATTASPAPARVAPVPVKAPPPAVAAPVTAALAAAAAPTQKPNPALSAPVAAAPCARQLDITSQLVTRVDGRTAGTVDFRQTSAGLQVRLGSIADVLADRYDAGQLARIRTSSAAGTYISLADLQARGIPISYDPVYDEFNVGLTDTRPKAARKVHIDQISAPSRGVDATGIAQVQGLR